MPAVTPAEPHNPELRGRPHAIQPARLRAPPQPAPFSSYLRVLRGLFFSVSSVVCFLRALHVVSDVGPAFQPALAPFTQCLSCNRSRLRPLQHAALLATPALLVEQAARLAMPASPWSKPPGLPCRRSRRQSDTIPNATGVPTPSGPHVCALHLNPPPFSSYLRVLSGLFFSVSSVPSVVCLLRALPTHRPPCNRTLLSVRPSVSVPSSPTSVSSVVCFLRVLRALCGLPSPCPPCRVRCGAGFLACGRLSSRPWPLYPPPSAQPNAVSCRDGPACPPLLLRSPCPSMLSKSRRRKVEQAARLAMPAVTPAVRHNPEPYGSSNAIRPARQRAPPQPAAA